MSLLVEESKNNKMNLLDVERFEVIYKIKGNFRTKVKKEKT